MSPDRDYSAATEGAAVAARPDRRRWTITGRDPAEMLNGIVTNTIPPPLGDVTDGLRRGSAPYGLTLTPKGRIVSDHRLMRLGGDEENAFLLDLPAAGADGLREHFGRYLPPRMARAVDHSEEMGMITVVGPEAAGRIARAVAGWDGEAGMLEELGPGDLLIVAASHLRIVRSEELGLPGFGSPPAYDLFGSKSEVAGIRDRLLSEGCAAIGLETLQILRVEGAVPAFGPELDESIIPVEAGIHDRAIDHAKGCYTGQEVIVRIRDRGHVNRHLRGLRFEDRETDGGLPERGAPLFSGELEREVGEVKTVVRSPAAGGIAGLGYVRREVEPGSVVSLGDAEGPAVRVLALDPVSWP